MDGAGEGREGGGIKTTEDPGMRGPASAGHVTCGTPITTCTLTGMTQYRPRRLFFHARWCEFYGVLNLGVDAPTLPRDLKFPPCVAGTSNLEDYSELQVYLGYKSCCPPSQGAVGFTGVAQRWGQTIKV